MTNHLLGESALNIPEQFQCIIHVRSDFHTLTTMRHSQKKALIHLLYGFILFVISLSTLEQFSQLNTDMPDMLRLPNHIFHYLMVALALGVACYEGWTMTGLAGLKHYINAPEHMLAPPPEGDYKFERASPEYMSQVYKLARRLYGSGYKFSEKKLCAWLAINPDCFYMMLFNDLVVGYIDAFPISEDHYWHLVAGGDEEKIEPQKKENINKHASFYVASLAIAEEHRLKIREFLDKAFEFYDEHYPTKNWDRVCAIAYTPHGLAWVTKRGMSPQPGKGDVWYLIENFSLN